MPISLLPDGPGRATSIPAGPACTLSRRDFLTGMALIGTGLAIGCSHRAGSRGNPAGWYAWLSDTHVGGDASATREGQTMAANLHAVVNEILDADDPPRALLINGDVALDDGQPGDYQLSLRILEPVRSLGVPLYLMVGNHDDRGQLRAACGVSSQAESQEEDKYVQTITTAGPRWLLLDSMIRTGQTGGELGTNQRNWLAAQLDAQPELSSIAFVHHNLNVDRASALHDTSAFLDLIKARPQIKAVVFGHTHVWHVQRQDGLFLINIPAVGYKFLRSQPLGWCLFRPWSDGGELELRPIGRDIRRRGVEHKELRWKTA